ncbi:MAG TPA: hypothetical protein VM869_05900 [Enhygromyxa sp.]|nr:hypothetical protein [Enhygromyxa sp.]
MISSWYGAPSLAIVDEFYRWSDRRAAAAMAAEQQLIRIADLSNAVAPEASVRQRAIEHTRNDLVTEVTLALIVVVDDPTLRGVVTAMRWVGGGRRELEIVEVTQMATAIELALERLRVERIPAPAGLDPIHYVPPRLASSLI